MNESPHPPHADTAHDFDVAIVGAGPVGLALAAWLARRSATANFRLALVDAREPDDATGDPRVIAVSEGSRMLLEPLGAWPAEAHAIERIHVSERGRFGRALIERDEHGLAALGYVARYGAIVHALALAVRRSPVHWFTSTSALPPQHAPDDDTVSLPIETGGVRHTLRARILVNAEGGCSAYRARRRPSNAATATATATATVAARAKHATTGKRRSWAQSVFLRRSRIPLGSASPTRGQSRYCRWTACALPTTRLSGA